MKSHLFVLLSLFISTFAMARANSIVQFFENAERQIETRTQCLELQTALNDMIELKPSQLIKKRYQDYQGTPHRWSASEILGKYFVSSKGAPKESLFYRDYERPASRASFRKAIIDLGNCSIYTN